MTLVLYGRLVALYSALMISVGHLWGRAIRATTYTRIWLAQTSLAHQAIPGEGASFDLYQYPTTRKDVAFCIFLNKKTRT